MTEDAPQAGRPNGAETPPSEGRGVWGFLQALRSSFGNRFLGFMVLNYFGLKGIVLAVLQAAMLPYFQNMGVKEVQYQLATVVAMIPWSMKGFIGVLSDIVPIGRFHKKGYLLLSAVLGFVGLLELGFQHQDNCWVAASFFALAFAFIATFDLLCEGKYSEIMRTEQAGSEVLTFVWFCMQMGAFLAAFGLMYTIDSKNWGARRLILWMSPFAIISAWRTCCGDLPEVPARSWHSLKAKLWSEPELFLLAVMMAVGSLFVALALALSTPKIRLITAVSISLLLIFFSFHTLPRVLARSNLYMFIISIAYMDLSGPLSYWYTGEEGCVPDGPHFSYAYYLAVSNVVGSLGASMGAVLFQYMQTWSFRSAFYVTTFVEVVASLFDLFILNRWNLRVGIPDAWAYLFGDAACQSIAAQMMIMPQALLTARLCPRGAEATVFAILAGFQNFGANIGSILGAQLAEATGIVMKRNGPCEYQTLPHLIVLCHVAIPLACLLLTWLVPSVAMNDESAFAMDSPPPSFASPGPSPPWSPETTPRAQEEEDEPGGVEGHTQEYYLMQEDGLILRQVSG
ncbi:Folate-biopterin transporter 1 [Durusdinium trenchii]|uniref:Chloroplastic n=2 Tax=Durusdinium trenchii TaxID=1381693 RepID=A0ABP0RGY8_9DINO